MTTMFVAFILLVNAIVSSAIFIQCASNRQAVQRKSQKSEKSRRSSRSRSRKSSKSRRSRKSSKSSRSSASRSSKSGKSGKSRTGAPENKNVQAAILADKKAAQDATKSSSEKSNKVSYANVMVIPHELNFQPIGGLKHVRVRNSTGKRVAFMVKCSDNLLYSISPVFGIIESERDAQINILRENGESKHDKLVVVTVAQSDLKMTAEQTFAELNKKNSHNYNINVVPILA